MKDFDATSPAMVAELEELMKKLAHKSSDFSPREQELMQLIRQSSDVILPQLVAAKQLYRGANSKGQEKLDNLIKAIEKICQAN